MASKRTPPTGTVDVVDAVNLGTEALVNEIRKLRKQSLENDGSLDGADAAKLIKYLHCAIAVSKDNRESSIQNELTEMPDDQIERLAREAMERKSA